MNIIKDYGKTSDEIDIIAKEKWTTNEMQEAFIVHGFSAPYIAVTRKIDKKRGTLEFGHSPRVYFNFIERGDF